MDVTALTLRCGLPETVTAVLTAREAALVAGVLGRIAIPAPGPHAECSEVYGALVSLVFNRYWEDGLDGAWSDLEMPPLPRKFAPQGATP